MKGTIRALREPDDDSWGLFDASFIFMSKAREITAYVHMTPGMKILIKPSDEVRAIKFGINSSSSLRPVGRRGPHPDDVVKVVAKLNAWVERKLRVWAYLDFGFSALVSFCVIESVNEQVFALTEESSDRTVFAVPALGSEVAIHDLEGATVVTITSEDRRSELSIFEPGSTRDDLMSRMVSKTIH